MITFDRKPVIRKNNFFALLYQQLNGKARRIEHCIGLVNYL